MNTKRILALTQFANIHQHTPLFDTPSNPTPKPTHTIERYGDKEINMNTTTKANLVKNRFAIDFESDNDAFEGFYNPNHRWNGWATPLFTKKVMERIISKFSTEDYPIVFEADYVPSEDTNETTSVVILSKLTSPSGEELYMNDGWCWGELD